MQRIGAIKPGFAHDLRGIASSLGGKRLRVADLLEASRGRGMNLLLVFLSLPFLTPIPLPGFSLPFGVAFLVIGGRIAFGQDPWLPQRVLNCELPPHFVSRLLQTSARVVKALEVILRPRWKDFFEHVVTSRLAGLVIAISGVYMTAPLPIPFSNSLPAFTVLLTACGLMEKDGAVVAIGFGMFIVTSAFFLSLLFGASSLTSRIFG
jgi:hypothetical protein